MLKINFRIKRASIFPILLAIFIVRPYYVQMYSRLNTLWAYSMLGLSIWSVYKNISVIKNNKGLTVLSTAIYIFCFLYIFSTLMNERSNTISAISECAQMIGGFNLGLLTVNPIYKKTAVFAMRRIFTAYLYLDAFLGFLNMGSLLGLSREMTFLGYDNYASYCILPMLAIKFSLDYQLQNKIKGETWFCCFICIAYKIRTVSFNGLFLLCIFGLLCYIVIHRRDFGKIFTPKMGLLIVVVLVIGVNVFKIQNAFSGILLSSGKGTTLGFRTVIWDYTIRALFSAPLWGYGKIDNGSFQTIVGLSPVWDKQANHAHNLLLELWFSNGIIGMLIYIIIIAICAKGLRKKWHDGAYRILVCGVFIYVLLGFIDGYPYIASSYVLFSLLYCIGVHTECR